MTVGEMAKYIDKEANLTIEAGELTVRVTVRDVKTSFGNDRMLIEPVNGTGTKWVDASRLKFD